MANAASRRHGFERSPPAYHGERAAIEMEVVPACGSGLIVAKARILSRPPGESDFQNRHAGVDRHVRMRNEVDVGPAHGARHSVRWGARVVPRVRSILYTPCHGW